jgi:hypothetical protein
MYGGVRFAGRIHSHVSLDAEVQLGGEKEKNNSWVSVGAFEGEVGFKLGDDIGSRMGYQRSGSRLISPDGFRSNRFFISLDFTF